MISLEEAISRILDSVRPLPACRAPLAEAFRRFSATDILSHIDLPLFDNSAMDGYAVRSDDLKLASRETPVKLHCAFRVAAGDRNRGQVGIGECARLFTGSPMPEGADAVVMQEDITVADQSVEFTEATKPLENVRLRGEDLRSGEMVLSAGQSVSGTAIGLLAATGHGEVTVHERCVVSLLATGSELREPGQGLRSGEIFESNRAMIAAFLEDLRATTRSYAIAADALPTTVKALDEAFASSHAVITTGGVSVGEFDFVKEAFEQLGGSLELWKIAMRPGKPFVFGKLGEKFLFGLPGNPVSAFVTFLLLVRPAILKMQGAANVELPVISGELRHPIANRGDRRHFVRVRWANGYIESTGPQKSHMLRSLAGANGLIDVPPGVSLEAGSKARVLLWDLPQS